MLRLYTLYDISKGDPGVQGETGPRGFPGLPGLPGLLQTLMASFKDSDVDVFSNLEKNKLVKYKIWLSHHFNDFPQPSLSS